MALKTVNNCTVTMPDCASVRNKLKSQDSGRIHVVVKLCDSRWLQNNGQTIFVRPSTYQLWLLQVFQVGGISPLFCTSDSTSTPGKEQHSSRRQWKRVDYMPDKSTTKAYLSSLQPDIFQLIVNRPVLSNTIEKAPEMESTLRSKGLAIVPWYLIFPQYCFQVNSFQ